MIIEDGRGNGYQAGVDDEGNLKVIAASDPISGHVSFYESNYYILNSDYSATADDIVICITNNDSNNLFRICRMVVSSSVSQKWSIFKVGSGTPGGTELTALNANFSSSKTPLLNVYGNAAVTGGLTNGGLVTYMRVPAGMTGALEVGGTLCLSINTSIALACSATGDISVAVCGWFGHPSAH